MSGSTGSVGGAGNGAGANVHGNNDTHDTRGADGAGSTDTNGASTTKTAQASAADTETATSAQASTQDGVSAHPDAHFKSEAPNPTGPTPSQVGTLTNANVATPMSMQTPMSAISETTAAVQKAAESAAAIGFSPQSSEAAPATSSFSITNSPATADGRPKVDPKTSFGEVGPTFSQTVDADKPSVAVTAKDVGMLATGDGVTVSATLHDAAAPKKTGVPSLDVTATYNSALAAAPQDQAAKSAPAQVPGVQFSVGATAVGTPQMAVNADAVLKGVGSSVEVKGGYNFRTKAVSLDGKLSLHQVDFTVHQDWTPNGASNSAVGVQYNFTENFWAKVEVRNKAGVGSFYGGIGIKGKF